MWDDFVWHFCAAFLDSISVRSVRHVYVASLPQSTPTNSVFTRCRIFVKPPKINVACAILVTMTHAAFVVAEDSVGTFDT